MTFAIFVECDALRSEMINEKSQSRRHWVLVARETYRFVVSNPAFAVITIFALIRFPVFGPKRQNKLFSFKSFLNLQTLRVPSVNEDERDGLETVNSIRVTFSSNSLFETLFSIGNDGE